MSLFHKSFFLTRVLFYFLFLTVPLIVTPVNYELFEFNKIMFVYAMTVLITASVLIQFVRFKKAIVPATPLDIPIFLFLLAMLISTITSIDPHMSLWGYYGRFNGGLVSIVCYILLYYSFIISFLRTHEDISSHNVLNLPHSLSSFFNHQYALRTAIYLFFSSAVLVSLYAVAQRFGIDAHMWVQDVQNRVFSTLGQPNWLASYITTATLIATAFLTVSVSRILKLAGSALLAGLIITILLHAWFEPNYCTIAEGFTGLPDTASSCLSGSVYVWLFISLFTGALLYSVKKIQPYLSFIFIANLTILFYSVLLATKSRSGFIAYWVSSGILLLFMLTKSILITNKHRWLFVYKVASTYYKSYINKYLILTIILVLITAIIRPPFSLPRIFTQSPVSDTQLTSGIDNEPLVSFDTNITDSGDIRRIVWEGAWTAASARPLFGFGVETFSWIYYRFKPLEHNLTSEWDFLYNKAHNEFLNYAATTGFVGLATYLLIIAVFMWWTIKTVKKEKSHTLVIAYVALLCAHISLHISHFFGFSVVLTSLLFWLIPAASISLSADTKWFEKRLTLQPSTITLFISGISVIALFLTFQVVNTWLADYYFAKGVTSTRNDRYQSAYSYLQKAHKLNPGEPLYQSELSETMSVLAFALFEQQDASASAEFEQGAIRYSNSALTISPANVSFWKSRTRLFYNLSQINPSYLNASLESMETAQKLAPTDPKIAYNRAILLNALGRNSDAITVLEEAIAMKPNYRDAAWALSIFYDEDGDTGKQDEWLNYILENINPEDHEVKESLGL